MKITELIHQLAVIAADTEDLDVMISTGDHIHPIAEVAPGPFSVWLRTPGRLSIQPATCGPLDVTGYRLDITNEDQT